jgi:NAD(P)-dependent dehydrogenase (short-subunit alcohol dehydrogenase family)
VSGRTRSLAGLSVLVTGANGGLGLAFVDELTARGARRVYAAVRDLDTAPTQWSRHDVVTPLKLDVTDSTQIAAAAAACLDVDLVISNAGVTCVGPVSDKPEKLARDVMEVNYFGPLGITAAFADHLCGRSGGMIFVLSMAAMIPPGPAPIYSASKSACAMFAAGVLADYGRRGMRVTLSFPGYIDTPMSAGFTSLKATPSAVVKRTLAAWCAGESHAFPDAFSEMVLEFMRKDGARMLTHVDEIRREIAVAYDALAAAPPD